MITRVWRPSRRFAQATTYLASTAKSNASDQAYWAALSDVLEHGSLPVPNHLRNAGDRRMKHHGIGVGYMYPHDFEGHDVNQQYLPDNQGPSAYCPDHRTGVKLPDDFAIPVTPLHYIE